MNIIKRITFIVACIFFVPVLFLAMVFHILSWIILGNNLIMETIRLLGLLHKKLFNKTLTEE